MVGIQKVCCQSLLLVLILKPTIATPQVARRDSIWDPVLDTLWKGLGAGVENFPGWFKGFIPDPPTPPQTLPDPGITSSDQAPQLDPGTRTPGDPSIPPPWDSQRSATAEQCGQTSPVSPPNSQCEVGLGMIIYALDCKNSLQNTAITGTLAQTAQFGVFSTSADDDCGIRFWTGDLTEEGANTMRSTEGVLAVVPDLPMEPDETPPIETNTWQKRSPNMYFADRRNRIERRDTLVKQTEGAYFDLPFVSTPPGSDSVVDGYSYFSSAGEGITVYVFDTGANPANDDFGSGAIKRWIFSSGARKKMSDEHGEAGRGSCAASKVAGVRSGVAKKASMIMVKYAVPGFLSSFLNGLLGILNDLLQRERAGENLAGYNVINSSIWFRGSRLDKHSELMIELLITIMINRYRISYVCGAGEGIGNIDSWPAILSPKLPIIVVGGVYPISGITVPYSRVGPALTVSAPWQVMCASRRAGDSAVILQGTAFAASMVAGLVAYFLSLSDLGPILRRNGDSIPQAVKQHIIDSAYIRPEGTEEAIWNEIYPQARIN